MGSFLYCSYLFSPVESFFNLMNPDLLESINQSKKVGNFMIYANDYNSEIVNSGHLQSLVRQIKYAMSIREGSSV